MHNVLMRKLTLTAGYQPLAAAPLVASVTITCLVTNADPALFQGQDGTEVPWLPGEAHHFAQVNLAEILVKGTPGDALTIVGGSW